MTQIQPEPTPIQDQIAASNPPSGTPSQRKRRYSDPNDTKPDFSTLSRRQRDFLPVLANARTITEAAARAKVSRSTIHRWLRDETFREALSYTRADNDFISRLRIQNMVEHSLSSLMDTTFDPNPAVRIRAARSVLNFVSQMGQWQSIHETQLVPDDELMPWSVTQVEAPAPTPLAIPPPPR